MKHLCSPHHLLCQLLVFCGLGNLLLIHKKTNPIGHYRLKIFGFLQIHQEFNSTKNSTPPRIQLHQEFNSTKNSTPPRIQIHQEFNSTKNSNDYSKVKNWSNGEDIYFKYQFCKSATNLPSESYAILFINAPYKLMWSAFYSLRWNEAITISVFQFVKENINILRS
jgi:hypothetical protein